MLTHLRVTFDDGVRGMVIVRELVQFTGVFQPIQEAAFFEQVKVNPEVGTVSLPNDADVDSDVLSAKVTSRPISEDVTANKVND